MLLLSAGLDFRHYWNCIGLCGKERKGLGRLIDCRTCLFYSGYGFLPCSIDQNAHSFFTIASILGCIMKSVEDELYLVGLGLLVVCVPILILFFAFDLFDVQYLPQGNLYCE